MSVNRGLFLNSGAGWRSEDVKKTSTSIDPSSPTKVEPVVKDSERLNHKPNNSSSHLVQNPLPQVEEFITKVQTEASRPIRPSLFPPTRVEPVKRDPKYVNDYNQIRPLSPGQNRPPQVDESITKLVQTEASRPNRPSLVSPSKVVEPVKDSEQITNEPNSPSKNPARFTPLSSSYWYQNLNSTSPNNSPNGSPVLRHSYGDQYSKSNSNNVMAGDNRTLSKPMNDIDKAMEYLKQGSKTDNKYIETIDSREAAKRYGNRDLAARQTVVGGDTITRTIDSREAARKYNGSLV